MEDEGGQNLSSPFWLQTKANLRISSLFFMAVLLMSTAAGVLMILSCTNHIFKPTSVRKSWDTLNIVLVLVAAVVGFLSRSKNGEAYGSHKSYPSAPNKVESYGDYQDKLEDKNSVLRRNWNPDLREGSLDDGDYYRGEEVFDDLRIDRRDPVRFHRRHRSLDEVYYRFMNEPQTEYATAHTPVRKANLSPPLKLTQLREVAGVEEDLKNDRSGRSAPRNDRSVGKLSEYLENTTHREKSGNNRGRSTRKNEKDIESSNPISTRRQTVPSLPEQKSSKTVTKDFFDSVYYKKKKRRRQTSVDNLDSFLHEAKAEEYDIDHSQSILAPHPAPPPPPSAMGAITSRSTVESTTHERLIANIGKLEEISNSAGESPFSRIPPPPQPPSPSLRNIWKFVVKGDYVRINSNADSASDSVDPGETDPVVTPSAGSALLAFQYPSPQFCQSPDVNTKAESFITNFRAKLKLEKIHSMKKRELGLSSPGPYYFGPNNI